MTDTLTIVWGLRCPFELCDAETAELYDYEVTLDGGWQGILECVNGHSFVLSQPRRIL